MTRSFGCINIRVMTPGYRSKEYQTLQPEPPRFATNVGYMSVAQAPTLQPRFKKSAWAVSMTLFCSTS